jgi:hypothetical protein
LKSRESLLIILAERETLHEGTRDVTTPRDDLDAEFAILTDPVGRALLAEVLAQPRPGPADLSRWRKQHPTPLVTAALRLAEGQRKASGKFSRFREMWTHPVGVEQATSETVARHKAERFAGKGLVIDLCAGIGGDAIALAKANEVLAIDLDAGMTRRVIWNAKIYGVLSSVRAVQADAERFSLPDNALVHVDPDRRPGGRSRVRSVADYAPGLEFLRELVESGRGGAIKLGPASDFEQFLDLPGVEVELVSLGGECKEATVWFGPLATPGVARRATTLPSGRSWTDRDEGGYSRSVPSSSPIPGWVYDPDPALCRAGLLDGFARAVGLSRWAAGIDLLTGSERVTSPFLRGFPVEEILPFDLKKLRKLVEVRLLGPLEIKTRGLDLTPEAIRAQLRPPGPHPATLLVVAPRGEPARVILSLGNAKNVPIEPKSQVRTRDFGDSTQDRT